MDSVRKVLYGLHMSYMTLLLRCMNENSFVNVPTFSTEERGYQHETNICMGNVSLKT